MTWRCIRWQSRTCFFPKCHLDSIRGEQKGRVRVGDALNVGTSTGRPRTTGKPQDQDQVQDQGMDVGIRLIHIDPSQYEESVAAKRDEVHACREEKITRARRHGCTGPRAPCESQISVELRILSAHPPLPHCPPFADCCVYRGYTTVRMIVFVQRRDTDNPTDQLRD